MRLGMVSLRRTQVLPQGLGPLSKRNFGIADTLVKFYFISTVFVHSLLLYLSTLRTSFIHLLLRSFLLSQMEKATETMGNTKEKQFKNMMEAMTSSPHWYVGSLYVPSLFLMYLLFRLTLYYCVYCT